MSRKGAKAKAPQAAKAQEKEKTARLDPLQKRFLVAIATVFLLLAGTAEERTLGTITDEQQMLYTAVSMAEFGEVGIARGPLFAAHRPAGDAVSPYGMALSLVEVLPAWLAAPFERSFGAGSSQTLFVLTQTLLVTGAAAGAGLLALALGASSVGMLIAIFGTAFGSPLWAYTSANYSEPLQAVAFVFTLLFAVKRWPAAAGAVAVLAILAKGMNLVVAPFLLIPLLFPEERVKLALRALAGGAVPFGVWLGFEFARYGKPLASYGGQTFTHPPLDGLWRLLVGANKGLLVYFPLLVLALYGLALLAKRSRDVALAVGGSFAVVLLVSSAWWSWDGVVGWGPRLLVPLLPLLAAVAAASIGDAPPLRFLAFTLVGLGAVVNALGVFQPEAATTAYVSAMPRVVLDAEGAKRIPDRFLQPNAEGKLTVDRQLVAASDAALSPLPIHLFLLKTRLAGGSPDEMRKRLEAPPWAAARPELVPKLGGPAHTTQTLVDFLATPFHWPHLGSAMGRIPDAQVATYSRAWNEGLVDQILRAQDLGKAERAVALSERLFELTPSGYTAALYAESLRMANRPEMLDQVVSSLPREFHASPSLGVVMALRARDRGDEAAARQLLTQVAQVFPRPGIQKALASPLSDWPGGLHGMTGENLSDRALELPKVAK